MGQEVCKVVLESINLGDTDCEGLDSVRNH
jgi:hypothetical protein